MTKLRIFIACCLISINLTAQVPFTRGNIVVVRIGDGTAISSNFKALPVFLDEYTPAGGVVQSIALPTTVNGLNKRFVYSVDESYQGCLTLSQDGRFLAMLGYDADPGASNSSFDPALKTVAR